MTAEPVPICVDSSVVIRVLTGTAQDSTLETWAAWEDTHRSMVAPALIHFELCNALHQYTRQGTLSSTAVDRIVRTALALPIELVDDDALHREALGAARRYGIGSVYDAHFLALAERLGVEFVTADVRLFGRVKETASWAQLME